VREPLPHGKTVPTTRDEALRALGTEDAEMRRLLVRALEDAPIDASRGVLKTVLGDEDWRVRKEAVRLSQAIADRADVITLLVDALRGPSEEVALRNAAVEALSGLGLAAVEAVEMALVREGAGALDADGRKLALEVLGAVRHPRSLPIAIRALHDGDRNVRAAAAEAIGQIGGDDGALALLSLLAEEDRFLRLVALEGLNRLERPIPFDRLSVLLSDKIVRPAAVAALARADDQRAFVALVEALGDPSRQVGEAALRALAAQLRNDEENANSIGAALQAISTRGRERVTSSTATGDVHSQRAALSLLALVSDTAAIDALIRALADDSLCDDAELSLVALGERAVDQLVEAARRGESVTRIASIRLLPRIASANPVVLEILRESLRDSNQEVVAASASAFASALGAGASPNSADVHALLRGAASREPKVAANALGTLRMLARIAPDVVRPHLVHVDVADDEAPVVCALLAVVGGPEHLSWLSRAVSAESARTRKAAVEALGEIGGAAAATAVQFALTDEVQEVALAAVKALGRARDANREAPGVVPLLRLIGSSEDKAIVAAAIRALGQTEDPKTASALRPLVRSSDVPVACSALEALADLGVEDLVEVALNALAHPSSIVVRAALDVLETLATDEPPSARVMVEVARALSHPSWEVRRRAAELVALLDPLAARPLLVARAEVESEPSVREAIDRGLADLSSRGFSTSRPPPRSDGR